MRHCPTYQNSNRQCDEALDCQKEDAENGSGRGTREDLNVTWNKDNKYTSQASESNAAEPCWWQVTAGPCTHGRKDAKWHETSGDEKKHDEQTAAARENARAGCDQGDGDDGSEKAKHERQPSPKFSLVARGHRPNENKMSDDGRGRASLGVEVWRSSQRLTVRRPFAPSSAGKTSHSYRNASIGSRLAARYAG